MVSAPIATYRIEVFPPAPYVDKVVTQNVSLPIGGTTVHYRLRQVPVLLVDDDLGLSFQTAYQGALARLGFAYHTFSVADSTTSVGTSLTTFAQPPVVLWFTGNDTTNALTNAERQVLVNHLNGGGRAIITGQNIAEYSSPGDVLLAGQFGIQYNGLATASFLSGFSGDVIGNGVAYLMTGGINPQTSKDRVSIIGGSAGTPTKSLYYGTTAADTVSIAAVRVLGPGGWGAVFYGFGIEGLAPIRMDTLLLRSFRYFDQIVVGVEQHPGQFIPGEYSLSQNYPNPFNPSTSITYALPEAADVSVKIHDLLGREVRTLFAGRQDASTILLVWDGKNDKGADVASGVYVYRITAAGRSGQMFMDSKRMLLLR
jgi:hypothetical protein